LKFFDQRPSFIGLPQDDEAIIGKTRGELQGRQITRRRLSHFARQLEESASAVAAA
jgi:hypothetical protein